MSSVKVDLGNLANDYKGILLGQLSDAADEEKAILKWGAARLETAVKKWKSKSVTEAQFRRWIFKLSTLTIPAKASAAAQRRAKAMWRDLIGGIFKGLSILAGAI